MGVDSDDDFAELDSITKQAENSYGDYEYAVTFEGYTDADNWSYDEIPQAGRQRVNLNGLFINDPDINDNCHGIEGESYTFRLEYQHDDYDVAWENPTPHPDRPRSEISLGLVTPLPTWLSAGVGTSVSIGGESYDETQYDYAEWDIGTQDFPNSQDDMAECWVDLDHNGDTAGESKSFTFRGGFTWERWDNCPEYHTNILNRETITSYESLHSLEVVEV